MSWSSVGVEVGGDVRLRHVDGRARRQRPSPSRSFRQAGTLVDRDGPGHRHFESVVDVLRKPESSNVTVYVAGTPALGSCSSRSSSVVVVFAVMRTGTRQRDAHAGHDRLRLVGDLPDDVPVCSTCARAGDTNAGNKRMRERTTGDRFIIEPPVAGEVRTCVSWSGLLPSVMSEETSAAIV